MVNPPRPRTIKAKTLVVQKTMFLTRERDNDIVVTGEKKEDRAKGGDKPSPTLLYLGEPVAANYQNGRGIDIERIDIWAARATVFPYSFIETHITAQGATES